MAGVGMEGSGCLVVFMLWPRGVPGLCHTPFLS